MNIYPAIDLRGGRVVRLLQGRANRETVYFNDPALPAQLWKEAGAKWIHTVDLDGAFTGKPQNWSAIEKIAATGLKIEMGGGMRTEQNIEDALNAGVSRVVLGTRAAEDPDSLAGLTDKFGGSIAVGIDAKNGKVAVKGWVDTTDLTATDLAKRVAELGVRTIIYTDISRDGMLTGPNFEAQEQMLETVTADIIASGGVSKHEDVARFAEMAETYSNLEGVIIGKALYDGKVDLVDLMKLV